MAWGTVQEVVAYTGEHNVDADDLTKAQLVIDIFSGVTEDAAPHLKARDLRLLKNATALQAVWVGAQVDALTRTDVSEADQDGARFKLAHDDALVLAPLAKRCLSQLSWRRPRSVRVIPTDQFGNPLLNRERITEHQFLTDTDGNQDWKPL